MLTERQLEIFNYISGYIAEKGFAPSRLDIASNFDFSVNAAQDHLMAIERRGYIAVAPNVSRGIVIKKTA